MGNSSSRAAASCFLIPVQSSCSSKREDISSPDDGLGHSFCYLRPSEDFPETKPASTTHLVSSSTSASSSSSSSSSSFTATTYLGSFKAISGASISANASSPHSISSGEAQLKTFSTFPMEWPTAFESSPSFSALPLKRLPRKAEGGGGGGAGVSDNSGPLYGLQPNVGPLSRMPPDSLGRGFASGPIEQIHLSGPIDIPDRGAFSAPIAHSNSKLQPKKFFRRILKSALTNPIKKAISKPRSHTNAPKHQHPNIIEDFALKNNGLSLSVASSLPPSSEVQWAQGKAGEDRMHIVLSEDHGWLFVGIYDGFNGPDAPDFLLSNLYPAVQDELQGLLWDQEKPTERVPTDDVADPTDQNPNSNGGPKICNNFYIDQSESDKVLKQAQQRRKEKLSWKIDLEEDPLKHRRMEVDHSAVLSALSRALDSTESAFLAMADKAIADNPELSLVGSCILAMVMKGEDVYIMNVGDSRAVLAHKRDVGFFTSCGKKGAGRDSQRCLELESITEESSFDLEGNRTCSGQAAFRPVLGALQLSSDHSTSVEEEVRRIQAEHPDDGSSIMNNRVKGTLKVTRAFGAGFLKQPKWNDALLEMFRIDFKGTTPYLTCKPALRHHRLRPGLDRFLVLSSDGLYQYLTNEEVVAHVECFMETNPDGDPAQHLIEQLLFCAAKKAGLDFHELLDIPHGDRRKYHDDVSVMVISLDGKVWRSSSMRDSLL